MEKELLVRYRIDGLLHDAMVLPTDRKCTAELVRESISLTTLLA
jgi:type II secretory ATPase GspE/PulE/Tfp pilus assembly ATPase PilB-like protein